MELLLLTALIVIPTSVLLARKAQQAPQAIPLRVPVRSRQQRH